MGLIKRVVDHMDATVFSLRNPWIIYFLLHIFTFTFASFTVFIVTSLILSSSAFLFLTHSQHTKVQLTQQEVQQDLDNIDYSSESEVIDPFACTTEEDSDSDRCHFSGEVCRRSDCSDGSISDDESLIEIEIFGEYYDGYKGCYKDVEEEVKFCRRKKSPDSVLWWPEEENMIEIDLLVGSIKS